MRACNKNQERDVGRLVVVVLPKQYSDNSNFITKVSAMRLILYFFEVISIRIYLNDVSYTE